VRRRTGVALALAGALMIGGVACSSGDDGGAEGAGSEGDAPARADASVAVTAKDIFWEPENLAAPAGAIEVTVTQAGAAPHTFVLEGVAERFMLEVTTPGETDTGVIDLAAGEYTFYCDVPGHRQAGMEGTLTVT